MSKIALSALISFLVLMPDPGHGEAYDFSMRQRPRDKPIDLFNQEILERIAQGPTLENDCDCAHEESEVLKYNFDQVFPLKNFEKDFLDTLLFDKSEREARKNAKAKRDLIKKQKSTLKKWGPKIFKDSLILAGKRLYNGDAGIYVSVNVGGPKIDVKGEVGKAKKDAAEILHLTSVDGHSDEVLSVEFALYLLMANYQSYFAKYWGGFKGVQMDRAGMIGKITFEKGSLTWKRDEKVFSGKLDGRNVELRTELRR